MTTTPNPAAVEAIQRVLNGHRYVYGQQVGRLCACGAPDPFGQRQGNGSRAHRAHIAHAIASDPDVQAAMSGPTGAALVAMIRDAEAGAWDEGATAASKGKPGERWHNNPYREAASDE